MNYKDIWTDNLNFYLILTKSRSTLFQICVSQPRLLNYRCIMQTPKRGRIRHIYKHQSCDTFYPNFFIHRSGFPLDLEIFDMYYKMIKETCSWIRRKVITVHELEGTCETTTQVAPADSEISIEWPIQRENCTRSSSRMKKTIAIRPWF